MPQHSVPSGRFGPTSEPPVFMRMGRRFPIEAQPEIPSHSEGEFRDTVSASVSIGKAHPVLGIDNGMRFPFRRPRETASRNPRLDRDTVSRWGGFRKACPALRAYSGMDFPHGGLNRKLHPIPALWPASHAFLGRLCKQKAGWNENSNRLYLQANVVQTTNERLRGRSDG